MNSAYGVSFEFQPIEPFVIMEGELKRHICDEGCKLEIRLLKFWHWSCEVAQIGVPQHSSTLHLNSNYRKTVFSNTEVILFE